MRANCIMTWLLWVDPGPGVTARLQYTTRQYVKPYVYSMCRCILATRHATAHPLSQRRASDGENESHAMRDRRDASLPDEEWGGR